jgi:hypothetical protein
VGEAEQEAGEGAGEEETGGTRKDGSGFPGGIYGKYVYTLFFLVVFFFLTFFFFCFAEDLAGLKVSHDFDELEEGEARILTLKDSRILDNEGV